MTTKQWTGAGGTNNGPATVANSGGASGDAFDAITLAGAATATYSSTAPLIAGQMALRLQAAAGGTDRARAYHSYTASDTLSERFAMRNRADPGTGGNAAFQIISQAGATFAGAVSLLIVNASGVRQLRLVDAAGALLKNFGAIPFGSTLAETRTVDICATKGTTTTDGKVLCNLYDASGALLDSFAATNVNTGTAQFVRAQWGGNAGTLQDLEVMAVRGNNEAPAALIGLPASNVAPTASIMARPAPQVAGSVTVSGTVTDTDGSITAATVSIVSGPNNPTVAVAPSGLNSGSCTVTGTFTALPGRYVVAVSGVDSSGAPSNVATQTIDVYPPSGTEALPEVRLSGAYTVVGAGSALAAVQDADPASYVESPTAPTAAVERWRWNPIGGPVSFKIYGYQSPTSPTINVTAKVYREDGVTLVESFGPVSAPTTEGPLTFTLSSANQAALAAAVDKRALILEYSATQ